MEENHQGEEVDPATAHTGGRNVGGAVAGEAGGLLARVRQRFEKNRADKAGN